MPERLAHASALHPPLPDTTRNLNFENERTSSEERIQIASVVTLRAVCARGEDCAAYEYTQWLD